MNVKPKKLIGRLVASAEIHDLEGSLSGAVGMFREWQRRHDNHGSQWSNLRIELSGPDYEGPSTIELLGDRDETKDELAKRMAARVAAQKRRRKRRAALTAGEGT